MKFQAIVNIATSLGPIVGILSNPDTKASAEDELTRCKEMVMNSDQAFNFFDSEDHEVVMPRAVMDRSIFLFSIREVE